MKTGVLKGVWISSSFGKCVIRHFCSLQTKIEIPRALVATLKCFAIDLWLSHIFCNSARHTRTILALQARGFNHPRWEQEIGHWIDIVLRSMVDLSQVVCDIYTCNKCKQRGKFPSHVHHPRFQPPSPETKNTTWPGMRINGTNKSFRSVRTC
jgi:hypothetical protein